MKYAAPLGSAEPDASYTDPVDGTIPAAAVEQPMREIASVIASMGIVPSQSDLTQLDQAIDLKVAAVQPDLTEFVSRDELTSRDLVSRDELARYVESAISAQKYELCEFYYFRNPALKPGFQPAQGKLLENAAVLYPDAWAFLHTEEGRSLCITEAAWQAMSRATWATLASGAKIGWNGIGGVPFYVADTDAGSLRLPDVRGMYAEAAGFDGLEPGGAHGDAIRNITGYADSYASEHGFFTRFGGVLNNSGGTAPASAGVTPGWGRGIDLDVSRTVPTANKNQPRAWGALACVYLGRPAS